MIWTDYLVAWTVYLLLVLLACSIFWYITWNMRYVGIKRVVRIGFACFLLTPYYSDAEQQFLAPAFIVALFDALSDGAVGMIPASTPILLVIFCSTILSLILSLFQRKAY